MRIWLVLMTIFLLWSAAIASERVPVKYKRASVVANMIGRLGESMFRLVPSDQGRYIEIFGDDEAIDHAKKLIELLDVRSRTLDFIVALGLNDGDDDIEAKVSVGNNVPIRFGGGEQPIIATLTGRILSTGKLQLVAIVEYSGGRFEYQAIADPGSWFDMSFDKLKTINKEAEQLMAFDPAVMPKLKVKIDIRPDK